MLASSNLEARLFSAQGSPLSDEAPTDNHQCLRIWLWHGAGASVRLFAISSAQQHGLDLTH